MRKKHCAAAEILRQRLDENPRLPKLTRHVLAVMATDAARPVWDLFGREEQTVNRVCDRVRQALEQSLSETSRPTATDELADLKAIIKKAKDLQRAIKASSLPGDLVYSDRFTLEADGEPPVPIDVGWHSLRPKGYEFGYPLAISDVLDWTVELVQHHIDRLPSRSLARQKDNPELTAFVRRLAWHFNREFKKEHRTAIGHIASAVFNLPESLDEKGVEARLRGRRPPLTT